MNKWIQDLAQRIAERVVEQRKVEEPPVVLPPVKLSKQKAKIVKKAKVRHLKLVKERRRKLTKEEIANRHRAEVTAICRKLRDLGIPAWPSAHHYQNVTIHLTRIGGRRLIERLG